MIYIYPVASRVVERRLIKQILAGNDVLAKTLGSGQIGVSGEIAGFVVSGQFDSVNLSLLIVVWRQDQRWAELAFVDEIPRLFVEGIDPRLMVCVS